MSRRRSSALALASLLVLSGSTSPILARDRTEGGSADAYQAASLWNRFVEMWKDISLTLLKNGSGIDPFGRPAPTGNDDPASPPNGGDNGSGIDPFGGKVGPLPSPALTGSSLSTFRFPVILLQGGGKFCTPNTPYELLPA